jgi:hypothetical protein
MQPCQQEGDRMQPHDENPTSFRSLAEEMPPLLDRGVHLAGEDRALSHGEPARALLGVLPIARWIPQDIHSVMDYANGLVTGSCAVMTDDPRARMASLALAASLVGVSAITDYRLSAAKLVPIEAHEAIDHVWGLTAIAAPFLLGYWKSEPKVALMHVVAGAGTILASLFTDYRSYTRRNR